MMLATFMMDLMRIFSLRADCGVEKHTNINKVLPANLCISVRSLQSCEHKVLQQELYEPQAMFPSSESS